MKAEAIQFNDKKVPPSMGRRSYVPFLVFQKGDEFFTFKGESIPGVCRVLTSTWIKNGVWSHNIWDIKVGGDVTPWRVGGGEIRELGKAGYGEDPTRAIYVTSSPLWEKIPEDLRGVVRACMPEEAARLDENDLPV